MTNILLSQVKVIKRNVKQAFQARYEVQYEDNIAKYNGLGDTKVEALGNLNSIRNDLYKRKDITQP